MVEDLDGLASLAIDAEPDLETVWLLVRLRLPPPTPRPTLKRQRPWMRGQEDADDTFQPAERPCAKRRRVVQGTLSGVKKKKPRKPHVHLTWQQRLQKELCIDAKAALAFHDLILYEMH